MAFSNTQLRALKRALRTCDIRTRQAHGRELSYIEGWHAIAEANRIFGFDAWSRETIESKCVLSREVRGAFHVVYVAKVRVSVRAAEQVIVREGFGTGEAQSATLGEAHDKAIKTAETDATKRALATFGKPFGLALYLGHKTRPRPEENADRPDIERRRTLQRLGPNGRYYVPYSKVPPIDPELAAHNAASLQGSAPANDAAAPETQNVASTESTETAPPPPTPVTDVANTTALAPTFPNPDEIGHKTTDLLLPRTPRRREPAHLRFVATQPCLVCGRTPSDAHHLRFAQPRALGRKVSDEFTIPLCRTHHRQLHHTGDEVQWWLDMEIDPTPIARSLWEEFRDQGKTSDSGQTTSSALTAKG